MTEHSDAAKTAYPPPALDGIYDRNAVFREVFDEGFHDPTPHRKMIVDGQIEVCDRCLNADGNPIEWSQAWHKDNKQATAYAVTREALAVIIRSSVDGYDTPEGLADAILASGVIHEAGRPAVTRAALLQTIQEADPADHDSITSAVIEALVAPDGPLVDVNEVRAQQREADAAIVEGMPIHSIWVGQAAAEIRKGIS